MIVYGGKVERIPRTIRAGARTVAVMYSVTFGTGRLGTQ